MRSVPIEHGERCEDTGEYRRLLQRFWENLASVWMVEEALVEAIAGTYLRGARLLRVETGAIRVQFDTLALSCMQGDRVRAEKLAEDADSCA